MKDVVYHNQKEQVMNVSAVSSHEEGFRKNHFIQYANSFMANPNPESVDTQENSPVVNTDKKLDKTMGIETLTIFPKQVINGKTTIIA